MTTSPRTEKSLSACVVRFQRASCKDKWETGIAILPYAGTSDVTAIIDLDGSPVDWEECYNYLLSPSQGCFQASDVEEFHQDEPAEEVVGNTL